MDDTNVHPIARWEMRGIETVTIAAGNNLPAGAVLGKIAATQKYTQLAPGAVDGSETAAGILEGDINATDEDKIAVVHVAECMARGYRLTWPSDITSEARDAAIAQLALANVTVSYAA